MEQTVRKRGPRQPYRSYSPTRTRGGHLHELLLGDPVLVALQDMQGGMYDLQGKVQGMQVAMTAMQGTVHDVQGNMRDMQGAMIAIQGTVHDMQGAMTVMQVKLDQVDARFGKLEAQVGNLIDWKHRVAGVLIASTGLMAMVGFLADAIPRWIGAIGH